MSAVSTRPGQAQALSAAGYEALEVRRGGRSGLVMAVAIHSTVLGPALGGCRMWPFGDAAEAIDDVKRLARAMTYKAAAAGLDLGGGKGVIDAASGGSVADPGRRRAALLDFGDLVESLGGAYITAEDVGTSAEDMTVISERTSHVVGLPATRGGSGDPSPLTALGVEAAMRACCAHRFGSRELRGRVVVVIGVGHVGTHLARRLLADGARVIASDIDPTRRRVVERMGANWVEPSAAMLTDCDIVAPCALGGAVHSLNARRLRAVVVCGSANNVLADEALAEELAARGVLYAPDFVANAGGLINVYAELHGLDPARAESLVSGIEDAMDRVLRTAAERDVTPLAAAREVARERLERAIRR